MHRIHMIGIVAITFDNIGWKRWKSLSILIRDIKNVRPGVKSIQILALAKVKLFISGKL